MMSMRRLLLGLTLLFGGTGVVLSFFSYSLFYDPMIAPNSSLWVSLKFLGYGLVFAAGVCGVFFYACKRPRELESAKAIKPPGRDDLLG